ncbi:MAG: TM2 domain-containing protein [Prevotella sp.]|uniref:TM2 domain-containing protein n=1 Tax=Prevotella sp. TaxID=59823 RepID=UPI002A349305|nr:NINE protein [Prevotella sp.]MDD7317304.1 TM2 domain-containing protein [Prevotellaceae bacterium]MDY4019908.1 TM2 domain-containing protein [Prevotella sp.]
MDANQINQFLALNSENLPEERMNEIRELLAAADDNKANMLNAISLKGKTMMLIISIFLGSYGVDRFMLGDTTMGVIKLLTCGGCGIWTIIDWFSIGNKTKEYNYKKIIEVLG